MNLYDAHNHLQDKRLKPHLEAVMSALQAQPIKRIVVNGTSEADWPEVLALARRYPQVIPSFGCHPWYVQHCTPEWRDKLAHYLDQIPSAIGEIGLDRGAKHCDFFLQKEKFALQLHMAAHRNLPVSIHCLKAWGPLLEVLRSEARPRRGFLLHSYGGSAELIGPLAALGAYFSLPGYFANEGKVRQRETFRQVPPDRLLIETDAPDQRLPEARIRFPLQDANGKALNHPANLGAVYEFAAELLGQQPENLAAQVECNFLRLFSGK